MLTSAAPREMNALPVMQMHHLGYYEHEVDAARAYDIAVRKFRGKKANTNLPPRPGRPPTAVLPPPPGRRGGRQVRGTSRPSNADFDTEAEDADEFAADEKAEELGGEEMDVEAAGDGQHAEADHAEESASEDGGIEAEGSERGEGQEVHTSQRGRGRRGGVQSFSLCIAVCIFCSMLDLPHAKKQSSQHCQPLEVLAFISKYTSLLPAWCSSCHIVHQVT